MDTSGDGEEYENNKEALVGRTNNLITRSVLDGLVVSGLTPAA